MGAPSRLCAPPPGQGLGRRPAPRAGRGGWRSHPFEPPGGLPPYPFKDNYVVGGSEQDKYV